MLPSGARITPGRHSGVNAVDPFDVSYHTLVGAVPAERPPDHMATERAGHTGPSWIDTQAPDVHPMPLAVDMMEGSHDVSMGSRRMSRSALRPDSHDVSCVERLAGIEASSLGPWFEALQNVVLMLYRDHQKLRSQLGMDQAEDLERLNYQRTAERKAVPLTAQVADLQRMVLRSENARKAAMMMDMMKGSGKPLMQRCYTRWLYYARRRSVASTLLSGNKTVMLRKYYRRLCHFGKSSGAARRKLRATEMLLSNTTRGVRLAFFHKWRRYVAKNNRRNPLARSLAFMNGKAFVRRYYAKLRAFPRQAHLKKKRWESLVFLGRLSRKGLAREMYRKLNLYRLEKKNWVAPHNHVVLGDKYDSRQAVSHALATTNGNMLRLIFFRKWKKWRWALKRGGVAGTMAVLRHRDLLNKYVTRLRKHGDHSRHEKEMKALQRRVESLERQMMGQQREQRAPPQEPPNINSVRQLSPSRSRQSNDVMNAMNAMNAPQSFPRASVQPIPSPMTYAGTPSSTPHTHQTQTPHTHARQPHAPPSVAHTQHTPHHAHPHQPMPQPPDIAKLV